MILTPSLTLQILLTAGKTTNDMDIHVDYRDWTREMDGNGNPKSAKQATTRSASNGVTATTILAAPQQDFIREPLRISIYNRDTADKIALLQTTDGSTVTVIWRITITTLKALVWERGTQWQLNI